MSIVKRLFRRKGEEEDWGKYYMDLSPYKRFLEHAKDLIVEFGTGRLIIPINPQFVGKEGYGYILFNRWRVDDEVPPPRPGDSKVQRMKIVYAGNRGVRVFLPSDPFFQFLYNLLKDVLPPYLTGQTKTEG